jgi:chromosome segregation protein
VHIRELQLLGFKSFQDKTVLRFSPGINAVIGPNGCGKTNILDALRWVLGEQSFSLLRCGRNEDVIFGGTAAVPPTNYAEVKLVLGNDDDSELGSEIEIKRRYFRSGESEYYLNRQQCRLKDIQEVFFSSGTGSKAYSIFDLRQMREIISGNIRKMFEEAATLAKYQDAKEDCQRKLALTESDLLRLDDIIAERERVVRTLQRQAGKLKAYDRLKSEEKSLRLLELKQEHDALQRELVRAGSDTEAMEQADAARMAEIHRLEEELKSHRGRLRDLQGHKDAVAGRVREQRQVVSDLEGGNLLARQRIEFLGSAAEQAANERAGLVDGIDGLDKLFAETLARLAQASDRQTAAQAQLEQTREATRTDEEKLYSLKTHESALRQQLAELLEEQASLRQERARLDAAQENQRETGARLARDLQALAQRLTQAREGLRSMDEHLAATADSADVTRKRRETLRAELSGLRARRDTVHTGSARLRQDRVRLEKELAVLRAATAQDQAEACRAVLGVNLLGEVSQFLEVRPGWESAFEAALYSIVDFLVVTAVVQPEQMHELTEKRPDLGFGLIQFGAATAPARREMPTDDAILAPLVQFVEFDQLAPALLREMVGQFLVVKGAQDLERLARAYPAWSFVTKDGACRFADGRLVVAAREQGRLNLGRSIDDKSNELAGIEAELVQLETEEKGLLERRERIDGELGKAEVELTDAERQRASLDATRTAAANQLDELARDQERIQAEQRSVDGLKKTAEKKRVEVAARLGEVDGRVETTMTALGRSTEEVTVLERTVRQGLERSAQALAELSEARQAVSRLETENAFAKRTIDDSRRRLSEMETSAAGHLDETALLEKEIAGRAMEIGKARSVLAELEAELGRMSLDDLVHAEEELESNLAELRRGQEQHQDLLLEQRLKLRELGLKLETVAEEAKTSYATDVAQFQPELQAGVTERLTQVRRRLEALGQVNPLAGREFVQEKQDLERLRVQRHDVGAAKVNLEQTMAEVDRHAREQFAATYSEVRGHFREIFRELFLEGEADLVMVNDANPLESEIAIVAKPRGKNPKRLEQLSDGEKALLAVSLLFAFYRVKPAPFCFLDEVDAPLDDANVGRVADYLKGIARKTQVVIITHNRLTVERADVVFGVTAEEPGISKLISVSLVEYRTPAEPVPAVS